MTDFAQTSVCRFVRLIHMPGGWAGGRALSARARPGRAGGRVCGRVYPRGLAPSSCSSDNFTFSVTYLATYACVTLSADPWVDLSMPHQPVCLPTEALLSVHQTICLSVYLPTSLSICPCVHPSMYLSVYQGPISLAISLSILSIYLSIYLSINLSIFFSIYLSLLSSYQYIYLSIHLYLFLSIYVSIYLSVYLSISLSLSLSLSIYLSIHLSISLFISIYLSIYLPIYLTIYFLANLSSTLYPIYLSNLSI